MINLEESSYASIIIDNGSESVKIGHAGDEAPRAVIENIVGYSRILELDIILDKMDYKIGKSAFKKRGLLDIKRPIENRRIVDFESMERVWHHCLYESLKVNPSQYSILLTESCEYSEDDRSKCAEIFFEFFNSPSLYMGNQGMLGLFSTGITKGVVLDSGEGGTHVIPLYEGYISPYSLNKTDISGKNITDYLHKLLIENGLTFSKHYDYDIVKDIKETKCYISLDYNEELKLFKQNANTKDILYELPDGQKINLNKEQIQTPEVLFKPNLLGKNDIGIAELIYKSYFSIDTEIRKQLFENIVLIGGNMMFPNIAERISQNMTAIGGNSINFKILCPAERKYSTWIGGSILSCLTPFENMWVTKAEYEEHGEKQLFENPITQGKNYDLYRPCYPDQFLWKLIKQCGQKNQKANYLDIGCGTGQLLLNLQQFFDFSIGNDISENMLKTLEKKINLNNIEIVKSNVNDIIEEIKKVENTKNISLLNNFQLVTIGQALHWMDVDTVLKIVSQQLLKENGVFCVLGYITDGFQLNGISDQNECQQIFKDFSDVVDPHFDCDRQEIARGYINYPFQDYFKEICTQKQIVDVPINLQSMISYFGTYSAYNTLMKIQKSDPLIQLNQNLTNLIVSKGIDIDSKCLKLKIFYFMRIFKNLIQLE